MLDQSAVGLSVQQAFSYSWRDVILYNLSVGAGQDELEYVYEKGLKAIPTFGVIPCMATFGTEPFSAQPLMPTSKIEGLRKEGTLHMDHKLTLFRPIPTEGRFMVEKVITGVYDRGEGKGAKIQVEIGVSNEKGEKIFSNTMGYLNRWAGGLGGEKPPVSSVQMPERLPDLTVQGQYPANTPLLYRLTGDTFPLHADPEFARKSGFDRPIVHGLCSLGYACRILTALLMPGEPERLISIENQFRSVAMPGDTFILQVWNEDEGVALFRMIGEGDGKPILDFGRVSYR